MSHNATLSVKDVVFQMLTRCKWFPKVNIVLFCSHKVWLHLYVFSPSGGCRRNNKLTIFVLFLAIDSKKCGPSYHDVTHRTSASAVWSFSISVCTACRIFYHFAALFFLSFFFLAPYSLDIRKHPGNMHLHDEFIGSYQTVDCNTSSSKWRTADVNALWCF